MMSSGTRETWVPAAWPADPRTADVLRDWLADRHRPLIMVQMDVRGADLSGGPIWESWLTGSDLRGVPMQGVDLSRTNLVRARLNGADLTESDLVRAELNRADLRDAVLNGSRLGRALMSRVDARRASFRDCEFGDALISGMDARGADFRGARFAGGFLTARCDETTRFTGMHGSLYGPLHVLERGTERALDGTELQEWLRVRGATVEVLVPRRPRTWPVTFPEFEPEA